MRFGGNHGHHHRVVIKSNHDRSTLDQNSNTVSQSWNDSSGRVYESCIGSGCSRSPPPLRREFWESNRPLPDIVLKRKEVQASLQDPNKSSNTAGEANGQPGLLQHTTEEFEGGPHLLAREGRPRIRIKQSRDPLFVYNDASEDGTDSATTDFGAAGRDQIPIYHTPSPRRPRTSVEIPDHGNLIVDVDVTGDDESSSRVVTINNSGSNSVSLSVNNSLRGDVNECASLCCPATRTTRSRTPSPSSPRLPGHFIDRASSPVAIRSRSRSLGSGSSRGHSRSSSQGSVEVHDANGDRVVKVDEDENGNLRIQISTSDGNEHTSNSFPAPCSRNRSRSPEPNCCSRSPTPRYHDNRGELENSIEISSDDGDVQVEWQGDDDLNLRVDLENCGDSSPPRRVNVQCTSRVPPKSRSRSRSRSPKARSPRPESPKSQSPSAAKSSDPRPRVLKSRSLKSRPPWDNTTLPTGRGALRLDRPTPAVSKSRSPSKSRSGSPTSKSRTPSPFYSRTPSPKSRTPRKITVHDRLDESPDPFGELTHEYTSESVDSHSTSSCTPQRHVSYTPCRSRSPCPTTHCRSSRCTTPSHSRSRDSTPGSRSRSPHFIEIRGATPDVPQVTIHRDCLWSSEGSGSRSRSEPPSPRASTPRVVVHRSRSRSATPPQTRVVTSNSTRSPADPCLPCEHISRCCNCSYSCCSCSCCHNSCVFVMPHCHGERHHVSSSHCNSCHQWQQHSCHPPCSPRPSSSSTSACLSCCCCTRACPSSCPLLRNSEPEPEPSCAKFCPTPGDIIIRAYQRQPCPCSGKDEGQVEFFSHRSACGLREGDTIVRLGRFDPTGRWCTSDAVGVYMLGSHGLWIFLGQEEGHECLRPVQADQHQIVRTVNKWFKPRLGDLIIHTQPGPHSFYFWSPKRRSLDCDDSSSSRLLLRAYVGAPQVVDEHHNLSCCTAAGHLQVGYSELYVNVRKHWLFLGRDDHMFTECEIASASGGSLE